MIIVQNEYKKALRDVEKIRANAIDFIKKSVIEKHNGRHVLGELETFYEAPYEDDVEWLVSEIMVDDISGEIVYCHSYPQDDYDWHNIHQLPFEDLIYVMSLYS